MGGPGRDLAWTLAEAAAFFTESGIPCTAGQLEAIIAQLPGFTPSGRAPSGPQGGRGRNVYPVASLMALHSKLAPWL